MRGVFTNKQFQNLRDRFIDQQRDNKKRLLRGTSKQMWKVLDILSEHEIRSEEETKEFLRLLGIAADKGNFTNEEYQKFRNKYFNQQKKLNKDKKNKKLETREVQISRYKEELEKLRKKEDELMDEEEIQK